MADNRAEQMLSVETEILRATVQFNTALIADHRNPARQCLAEQACKDAISRYRKNTDKIFCVGRLPGTPEA